MIHPDLWVMIPARGGSRGVPRKNVRMLAGRPLIHHAIAIALKGCQPDRVVVITDDDEIAILAEREGVRVVREPRTTGQATLDDVAQRVSAEIADWGGAADDIFLTLQPTCPFLSPRRLDAAMQAFAEGARSVLTVVDDRHLSWKLENGRPVPAYAARVNRQQLDPAFRETGGIIGCRLGALSEHGTRIVEPIRLIEVEPAEALDIDTFTDWAVAEYLASRKSVVIRADAGAALGMGHAYRALALAQELSGHDVTIVCDRAMPLGCELISRHPFALVEVEGETGFLDWLEGRDLDLVILDQLDTTAVYVRAVRRHAAKVVSFEDLGSGSLEADLVVSDLYENIALSDERQLSGIANALLAPSFETDGAPADFRNEVRDVLVVFGGSDPSHLTERALKGLATASFGGHVTVVLGPGVKRDVDLANYGLSGEVLRDVRHMPGVIRRADLAISSAGRTVTELVSLGVPVLCLCQNEKELSHTHASARYGVINLGLGRLVDVATLAAHLDLLFQGPDLRLKLRERALHETRDRSNAAVMRRIVTALGWDGSEGATASRPRS